MNYNTRRPSGIPLSLLCATFLFATWALGCNPPQQPSKNSTAERAQGESSPAAAEQAIVRAKPEAVPVKAPEQAGSLIAPAPDAQAPDRYAVTLETTKGPIVIDVTRAWAPRGADRFYTLVRYGYFDDTAFFRVVPGFMAQIGIHGDPRINGIWRNRRIDDDPVTQANTRAMVSFATSGKDSRVNQFFINMVDNSRLDGMGFSPFGQVRDMAVVDQLHGGYGEGAPAGRGPKQARVQREGNSYLRADFPLLDYIERATISE